MALGTGSRLSILFRVEIRVSVSVSVRLRIRVTDRVEAVDRNYGKKKLGQPRKRDYSKKQC